MTEQDIHENTAIAKEYLKRYHMLSEDDSVIMECCLFPPYHWKTFFMQICGQDGRYTSHCAYTRYGDYFGCIGYSQTFKEVIRADKSIAKTGDVICRIFDIPAVLVHKLQKQAEDHAPVTDIRKGLMIDGIYAEVRLYKNGAETGRILLIDPDDDPIIDTLIEIAEMI